MSKITRFTFEHNNVRTLGDPISPQFIASDLAVILGYQSTKDATRILDDDEKGVVEIETNGGKQKMTTVTESGMYALVLKSRRPEAKAFRKWVTSEVLPSIRRTGSYTLPRKTISVEQQQAIRSAISNRAARSRKHYQTIYRALYERFRIPRYTELLASQFDEALNFINAADLNVPIATPSMKTPDDALVLDKNDAERIMNFVYYWRYLFKPELEMILRLLRLVDSPKAARFYEVVTELHLPLLEGTLERHGYSVKGMSCYKHLMNNH